tara:strand:+ start:147 stop:1238 length:1092 start_codon:yes stop_codon:yes gene_type:complete
MSDFRIDKITNRDGSSGTQIAGITTFSGTSGIQLPVGPTEYRGGRGGRGLICGGYNYPGGQQSLIQKIEIVTTGNTTDFGDMVSDRYSGGSCASSVRGFYCGGRKEASPVPDYLLSTQSIVFSSGGGASYWGDLNDAGTGIRAVSNNTRGLVMGGHPSSPHGPNSTSVNTIDYFTLATQGSASSFGDLTRYSYAGSVASSPTRGLYAGGSYNPYYNSPSYLKTKSIDYITFATKGDAVHFGELSLSLRAMSGASSATRAVFAGGYDASPIGYNQGSNQISYVTIASDGNGTDFGDLSMSTSFSTSVSNSVRGVFGHGPNDPAHTNALNYITISTTGNALDFGDMITTVFSSSQNVADSHGGIG